MMYSEDGACGEFFMDGILRCSHDFGHAGRHSWHNRLVHLFGGITIDEIKERARKGRPSALAMLATLTEEERST